MTITFKDLENFLSVSESRTLSDASEKLNMAQPSLSQGIKKLEIELGFPLFIRGRDGMRLTPHGKKLFPQAKEALDLLQKIRGKKVLLSFRVGCHPSVGIFVLGNFLKYMHQTDSHIGFEIVNQSSSDINKLVAQGTIDFGIVMNPLPIQGLISRLIGEDDVYVWESKSRYQNKLIYHPDMLQAHSIISRWKEAPGETVKVHNLELMAHLVDSGAGFGILPAQVVKAQKINLKKVPQTPSFKDHLALVCYPEMLKSKEGKIIFEALKKSFTSL